MSSVLKVNDLNVELVYKKSRMTLVDNVSFNIEKGQCLGILGESGSGKSITCKAIMGLLDKNFKVSGQAFFNGTNLLDLSREKKRRIRGKEIGMILQNPMTSFDPLYRINAQMEETFLENTKLTAKEIKIKSIEVLEQMKIKNPEDVLKKYPHQLSGGMLQRIMIGLSLALKPKLIIADEPTTAIDSITQYEIIEEFINIKNNHEVAMIFISHDLGVISKVADDVIVMHQSKVVEQGVLEDVFQNTSDAYTKSLIEKRLVVIERFKKLII